MGQSTRRLGHWCRQALGVGMALTLFVWGASADEAENCGQVLTGDTTLTIDLVNCPGDGLVIGADDIVLDLNGHTLDGVGLGVGIRNDGHAGVTIKNGTVQEFDYGVALSAGARGNIVKYMTLTRNEFAGVQVADAHENTLRYNTIDRQGNDGIVLLGDSTGNAVRNNTISNSGGEGLFAQNANGNHFESNHITMNGDRGVVLDGSSDNRLLSNTVSNNSDGGISLLLGSNNTLRSNTITGNGDAGLVVSDSEGTRILENRIHQSSDSGIFLERSNGSTIKGNDVSSNPGGIELNSSNGNWIEANTAIGSGGTGIELEDSADNDVVSNTTAENGAQGIRVEGEVESGASNRIDGNTADRNRAGGIVVASGGHTISRNAANNNAGWGIFVVGGNVDGGANLANDNAEAAQCFGIVCNEPALACPGTAVISADADSWIDQNSVNSNFGTDSVLKVRSKSPDSNVRALVRFRLPAIPEGCQVSEARLQLYAASATTGRTLQAWQLDESWTEPGVTWSNQPPPESMGAPATAPSALGRVEWDVTAQVQLMYGEGGSNNGFLIRDVDEENVASPEQSFHSREKTSDPQPALVITLTVSP